ncbi:MAG TPA: hypothetical protein VFA26_00005, partial [Gemmataceae bacterium]|nr:hypothetical protein [Gemmataceae bacterium]
GCGTVANLANQKPGAGGVVPFGGVEHDVRCMQQAANGQFGLRGCPRSDSEQYPQRAVILFCAADLPFSLVGDVVTWPYTASYTFINRPIPVPPVMRVPVPGPGLVPAAAAPQAAPGPAPYEEGRKAPQEPVPNK